MSWLITPRIALRALRRNKGRSLLTALGIIIGIAAVIAVVAVSEGVSSNINEKVNSMGNNLVMVFPGSMRVGGVRSGAGTQPTLTAEDGDALLRESPYVVGVSPVVRTTCQLVYRENDWGTSVQGVGARFPEVRAWNVHDGDFFTEADVRSGVRVCLLGVTVAENLMPGENPVGKTIRIQNMPFRVLGVMERKGSTAWGQDQDDVALIPWTTARRVLRNSPFNHVHQLLVSLSSMNIMPRAREEIATILRERHRIPPGDDDDFTVADMTEVTQMITQISQLMTALLVVIASISLVVGGIGIMNIMLVSVTERTREIGLRMAVGARQRDILLQFLVEAITLSGVGGVLGIMLGGLVAQLAAQANGWPVVVSPSAVLLALGFSAGVGVFFGFYPAWRAARMNPIESLRHE